MKKADAETILSKLEAARRVMHHYGNPEWELRPEYLQAAIMELTDAVEIIAKDYLHLHNLQVGGRR